MTSGAADHAGDLAWFSGTAEVRCAREAASCVSTYCGALL